MVWLVVITQERLLWLVDAKEGMKDDSSTDPRRMFDVGLHEWVVSIVFDSDVVSERPGYAVVLLPEKDWHRVHDWRLFVACAIIG